MVKFYRCSKAACEDYVKEFYKRFKLKYSILRFGSLYGPGSNEENVCIELLDMQLRQIKLHILEMLIQDVNIYM